MHNGIMSKRSRQTVILQVLENGPAASQDDLRKELAKHGFKVTQATLSRDIHELKLVKTTEGYGLPASDRAAEPVLPPVARMVRDFVTDIRQAQNLLVIKTSVGSAQPVAAALDAEAWAESVGTIAGDDTILIISRDKKAAGKIAGRLQEMLA
jgi:transcriptional regulator of arginine metabolism